MIKRTLCFSNPAALSFRNGQLVVRLGVGDGAPSATIPVEDIGVVVLDNPQISVTHSVFAQLLDNNAAIITCNAQHLPTGLLLPLDGNTVQCERFHDQIEASLPLKKQLWQQTVQQKILNQAAVLSPYAEVGNMLAWAKEVRSGDPDNLEGRAAAYYWSHLFKDCPDFVRGQFDDIYNSLLNYGYAILRACVARALVSSGLLPTFGIHHHNRYNAYCLADDIMEPYRPYVDRLVLEILKNHPEADQITTDLKRELLTIPTLDILISNQRSPLMVGVSQTTASLYQCFAGQQRKIVYPVISR